MRYFATYLIYISVIVRAIGWNQETAPISIVIWILLSVFGIILFSQQALTRLFPFYPRVYTLIQSVLAITMLYRAPTLDFLPMLFLPLSFQAVQFFPNWIGFTWIGCFILAMAGMLLFGMEWQAGLTMVLSGGGASLLMGSFANLIRRTEQKQKENQQLFANLQKAYRQLKDSAAQSEALAAAEERHFLVRELHDSLTQTLFSMNLAVQSAQLSTPEDTLQTKECLSQLQSLARIAASEVQSLTAQVPFRSLTQGGLIAAIQRLAEERLTQDGLQVTLEITGERVLPDFMEVNLYRITQESLNNIIRHAGVKKALIQLHLEWSNASLEIHDDGCGFDFSNSRHLKGFGLLGMAERANEIGWDFDIKTSPGEGTHVRVAEKTT